MGMLAGFVVGATDEYTKQRGEDRKEGREIEKEKRGEAVLVRSDTRRAKFDEIKARRLAEVNVKAAAQLVETKKDTAAQKALTDKDTATELAHQKGHTAETLAATKATTAEVLADTDIGTAEDLAVTQTETAEVLATGKTATARILSERGIEKEEKKVGTDQAAAKLAHERKMKEPFTVSPSGSIVTPDPDAEGGYLVQQVGHRPTTSSQSGQFGADDATKFFSTRAEKYFGKLDESGKFLGFGTDRNAQLAASSASVADRMWTKYKGQIDPNTIWAISYKEIKNSTANTAQEVSDIEKQLLQYDSEWWLTESQDAEVAKIVKEIEAAEKSGRLSTMKVPSSTGGYLSTPGGIPTLQTRKEVDRLKSGDRYIWGPTGKPWTKK